MVCVIKHSVEDPNDNLSNEPNHFEFSIRNISDFKREIYK